MLAVSLESHANRPSIVFDHDVDVDLHRHLVAGCLIQLLFISRRQNQSRKQRQNHTVRYVSCATLVVHVKLYGYYALSILFAQVWVISKTNLKLVLQHLNSRSIFLPSICGGGAPNYYECNLLTFFNPSINCFSFKQNTNLMAFLEIQGGTLIWNNSTNKEFKTHVIKICFKWPVWGLNPWPWHY